MEIGFIKRTKNGRISKDSFYVDLEDFIQNATSVSLKSLNAFAKHNGIETSKYDIIWKLLPRKCKYFFTKTIILNGILYAIANSKDDKASKNN